MRTLAVDVGGSGIKASVLDSDGSMVADRVRVATTYPLPPDALVRTIKEMTATLPAFDRVSVGFPGMVRDGKVLSAPHFVTIGGPGSKISPELQAAWQAYDLAGAVEHILNRPTKAANDADLQGAAVIKGVGLELVITLGTGMGTALFYKGRLAPHLELAHHPFRRDESYNEQVGDAARRRIGSTKWNKRVRLAVETLDALFFFDHLYVGGGNASRIEADLGRKTTIVDNSAGILGGIKLWDVDPLI
jgi:polyphosphate glucokinase